MIASCASAKQAKSQSNLLRPEVSAALGFNELDVDPYLATGSSHTAFENIAHAELAAGLRHVNGFGLIGECRVAGDHEAFEFRERSVVRSSVTPSAKYSSSGSSKRFAKGRTTIDNGGTGLAMAGALPSTGVGVGGSDATRVPV